MKRPGLIRWNFFSYLVVISVMAALYLFLGLDGHVKRLVEQKLSALNGAPVVIQSAKMNLSGPRIMLETLEFRDPHSPDRNQIAVASLQLDLEWQALLRNRLVIRSSVASGVQLPPLMLSPAADAPKVRRASLLPPMEGQSIGLASDFLLNPDRKQLPPEEVWMSVPSTQAKTALNAEISGQVSTWTKQVDTLAAEILQQKEDLKSKQDSGTHAKLMLSQLERSRLELDHLETQIKTEGNVLLSKIGTLSELLPHDVTVIRQAVKLPSLEFKTLSNEIGTELAKPLMGIVDSFYFRLLPWIEKREQVLQNSFGRRQGTEFYFTGRYLPPRLWIKKLDISSKASPDGSTGDVIGRIEDLSSEPFMQPAHMSLQASFPKAEVANVQLEAQIDHRNAAIDDRLQLNVMAFPIRDLDLSRTPNLRVGIEQGVASLNLEFIAQKDSAIINLKSSANKLSYRVETSSDVVKRVFDEALAPLTTLDFEASAQGKVPDLHWTYVSNMSDRLRGSLQQTLGQEYAEFQARIKERADQRGLEAKKELETKLVTESEELQGRIAKEKESLKVLGEELTSRASSTNL